LTRDDATTNQINAEQIEPEPFIPIQGPSTSPIDTPNPNESVPQVDDRRHGKPMPKASTKKKNQPTTNLDQAKRQVNSVGQAGGRKGGNLKVLQPSNSIDIIM
jgi:hypothetical protein